MLINGKNIAGDVLKKLSRRQKPKKILAAVLVGNNSASISFLKQKEKIAEQLGVDFRIYVFQASLSAKKLKSKIRVLNNDKKIGGIILQLPLPRKFMREEFTRLISANKDVDALTRDSKVLPPTVGALEKILKSINFNLRGKKTVVIGKGFLVGAPVSRWLMDKCSSLVIADKETLDIKALREADLVVTGVGEPEIIKAKFIKKGATLVDFGYSMKAGKILGDLNFKSCFKKAAHITPTPGGTGPIVVAQLFENFFRL